MVVGGKEGHYVHAGQTREEGGGPRDLSVITFWFLNWCDDEGEENRKRREEEEEE